MNDTPTERAAESTWTRLRRRKVVQWGVAYAAGAWLLMQVLEYFSGTFDWPRQVQQLSTLALLIGLPIVLVLAWYHGDRGERHVSRVEFALLTALFLLGGTAFWWLGSRVDVRTLETADEGATTNPSSLAPVDTNSIAVLPFVNMSDDPANEYFSDGLAEEMLNLKFLPSGSPS